MQISAPVAKIKGKLQLIDLIALYDYMCSINHEKLILDFNDYIRSSIFDLTFLASQIRAIQLKKKIRVDAIFHENMLWSKGMNFFSVSGTDWASQVIANHGDGVSFIAITVVERNNE